MPIVPIKGIVFDFDGTLAQSTIDFAVLSERARQALFCFAPDIAVKIQAIKQHTPQKAQPTLEELESFCQQLVKSGEISKETILTAKTAAMQAIAAYECEAAKTSSLFPFVRPLLNKLYAASIPVAVITRNCFPAVSTVFPDIKEHFSCVLTRDDVEQVKPHPAHLLQALDIMQIPPANALMVGDHPLDIETGKRAGTQTLAVASGEYSFEALIKAGADYTFADASGILDLIS